MTKPSHPYMDKWWPPSHIIGYEHTFVHTIADFVKAVAAVCDRRTTKDTTLRERRYIHPTFEDGSQNQRVLDAVARSVHSKRWIDVKA